MGGDSGRGMRGTNPPIFRNGGDAAVVPSRNKRHVFHVTYVRAYTITASLQLL